MFYDCVRLKGPQLHTDSWSGPSFEMRRLWRLWRHDCDALEKWVTWRHRWRHQSTRRMHFPKGSLLYTNP